MFEKIYLTPQGCLHYWTSRIQIWRTTLVFLPGLTADHRLFDMQAEYFSDKFNVIVWDAPGHGRSRPFNLEFSLMDKAEWLHGILKYEKIEKPFLVGQSMGGYLAQCYMQRYPGEAGGFISIDSAPLQRRYYTFAELWMLKHAEPLYRAYSWERLIKSGSKGNSESEYGRNLMREMMMSYNRDEFCRLAGHGFKILAQAVEAGLPYKIDCPAMLLCGERDKAGSAKRYNRAWSRQTGISLTWIKDAGHNSNTDQPDIVNKVIEDFVRANSYDEYLQNRVGHKTQ